MAEEQNPNPPAPTYVTADELSKQIAKSMAAFKKEFADTVKASLGELAPQIDQIVEAKLEGFKLAPKPGEQEPKQDAHRPEDSPAFKGLQRQLEQLRKDNESAKQEAAAQRAKADDAALRQAMTVELARHGIKDPARAKYAVGALLDQEKRVRMADGKAVYVDDDGSEYDLKTGVESWAKTPDAKLFMDPRNPAGSGGRPGSNANQKTNAAGPSLEDVGNMFLSHASGLKLSE